MRFCELREKEVINCCSCKRLGCVADIEFDPCSGTIEAIIIPGPGKYADFSEMSRNISFLLNVLKKSARILFL